MSPALSDLAVRKVVRVLESVGFEHVRTKGSHAIYRHPNGRVVVVPMHGTVKRGTLASIVRQAGLTSAEFLDLLGVMTREIVLAMVPRVTFDWYRRLHGDQFAAGC